MFRPVFAVVLGVVTWFAVATVGNFALRQFIPGYSAVERRMNFTFAMQIARLALGLVSSLCAGIATAAVSRPNSYAVKVVAAGMVLLFLPVHYSIWARFPVWYHAFFLITLAPAVLFGAAVLRRSRSPQGSPSE